MHQKIQLFANVTLTCTSDFNSAQNVNLVIKPLKIRDSLSKLLIHLMVFGREGGWTQLFSHRNEMPLKYFIGFCCGLALAIHSNAVDRMLVGWWFGKTPRCVENQRELSQIKGEPAFTGLEVNKCLSIYFDSCRLSYKRCDHNWLLTGHNGMVLVSSLILFVVKILIVNPVIRKLNWHFGWYFKKQLKFTVVGYKFG